MTSSERTVEYEAYIARVEDKLGGTTLGGYAKFEGRLIKVLDPDEFQQRWNEYQHIRETFDQSISRGDTVNDALVQMLQERAAELLFEFEL